MRYTGVYPGVDLVYYGTGSALEYDFVVAPGADASQIALGFSGQQNLKVDLSGNLTLALPGGQTLSLQKPVLYQQVNGARKPVAGSYHLGSGNRVTFDLGAYDHTAPLVIDPVFIYSTYLGGNSGDNAYGIAVDGSGNAYVTGLTYSTNFPTINPPQASNAGNSDAFVAKLNASGTALVYSTYLGGSGDDQGNGIVVDGNGNAYVTGTTFSTDFPTVNPLQASNAGNSDAFVSKLSVDGTALIYSTYLGGSGVNGDTGAGIAVDGSGNAYVTGVTTSSNFPTVNPLQASNAGGIGDAFVSKLNVAGSALVYSTYLGGSGYDAGNAIAVDASGNAYVTGYTSSTNFPTANPFQSTFGGGGCCGGGDAFVSKLSAAGSALVYSTYLGGSTNDTGNAIAVDASGSAYIVGNTSGGGFPTTVGAFQTTFNGGVGDGFVTKFTPAGSALSYSTFLGSLGNDSAFGLAVDSAGNAFITGNTDASSFPLAQPVLATFNPNGSFQAAAHAYVSELNPAGTSLLFSTYLEGSDQNTQDRGYAVAADSSGSIFVAGATSSADFSVTTGALQTAMGSPGYDDGFVAHLQPAAAQRNPTVGVYRPSNSTFYLRNTNSSGPADLTVTFGAPGDIPVTGDWTGKGYDTIGIYRPSTNTFYLRNSNTTGNADIVITFGASGDIPVVGDWTGKGYDSIGVFRPSTNQFLLRNSNTTGVADIVVTYGTSGDMPLVGDWTGQGKDTIGAYRPSTQSYYLRNSNTTGNADIFYTFGVSGTTPVMGDWLAQGRATPGYYTASNGTWHLRYLNSAGLVQVRFTFGVSTDIPLAGQWQPGPS